MLKDILKRPKNHFRPKYIQPVFSFRSPGNSTTENPLPIQWASTEKGTRILLGFSLKITEIPELKWPLDAAPPFLPFPRASLQYKIGKTSYQLF